MTAFALATNCVCQLSISEGILAYFVLQLSVYCLSKFFFYVLLFYCVDKNYSDESIGSLLILKEF